MSSRQSESLDQHASLAHRPDVDPNAYDLDFGGGLEVRLTYLGEGRWEFDELVLPNEDVIGGTQQIFGATTTKWLNDKREAAMRDV